MKGGLGGLMKQAQMMQENMKKAQEQLATVEVEGQSGGGMVKVLMTCRNDVKRVSIDASVMDDKEMLEDLLAAAINDAVRKSSSISLSSITLASIETRFTSLRQVINTLTMPPPD